jgi:hypothetical protein
VADEGYRAGNDDLAAARTIKGSDLTQALCGTHERLMLVRRYHVTTTAAEKVLK